MRFFARVVALALLPLVTGGCSLILVDGPPRRHHEFLDFACTETKTVPTIDAVWAGLNIVAALGGAVGDPTEDRGRGIAAGLGWALLYGWSAVTGAGRVDECRAAKSALAQRRQEAAERDRAMPGVDSVPVSLQAQTRATRPNDFGLEVGGKAALGSLSYQGMIPPWACLQAGWIGSWIGSRETEFNDRQVLIPLGGKLYMRPANASPFATGGIVVRRGPHEKSGPTSTETYPYAGLGYEARSNHHFFFRATLYALFLNEEQALRARDGDWPLPMVGRVIVWPGVYVGYAF